MAGAAELPVVPVVPVAVAVDQQSPFLIGLVMVKSTVKLKHNRSRLSNRPLLLLEQDHVKILQIRVGKPRQGLGLG